MRIKPQTAGGRLLALALLLGASLAANAGVAITVGHGHQDGHVSFGHDNHGARHGGGHDKHGGKHTGTERGHHITHGVSHGIAHHESHHHSTHGHSGLTIRFASPSHFSYTHYGVYGYPGVHHYGYYSHPTHYRYTGYFHRTYAYPRYYSYRRYEPTRQYTAYTPGPSFTNNGNPWENLYRGETARALHLFGREARNYPNAGVPKVGYAIAAAQGGDLNLGVEAMRKAFRVDPDALQQVQTDRELQRAIDTLIEEYEYPLQHRGRHRDEAFMVASLYYLKGDVAGARVAAERAAKDGDRSPSLKNLQRLLADEQEQDRNDKTHSGDY